MVYLCQNNNQTTREHKKNINHLLRTWKNTSFNPYTTTTTLRLDWSFLTPINPTLILEEQSGFYDYKSAKIKNKVRDQLKDEF